MADHKRNKSLHQYLKMILFLLALVMVAMVIEILMISSLNKRNSNKTSLVVLNQVVNIIEQNEQNEQELIETLKEDYIIRAQTVAYILDSRPEAELDVEELQKIADMMQIDEIHLFDETGQIYSGTHPEYYGFSFNSGEQISYFKPMLEDKTLTMCQDVTPNTAEGKSMMYAITWDEAGDKMIQVGITPTRLLAELRKNEIPEVVANMPAYEGVNILVADAQTGVIYGSTDTDLIDKTLDEIGITATDFEEGATVSDVLQLDGYSNYCNISKTGEYIVVAAYSTRSGVSKLFAAILLEFVYLMVAGMMIAYMVKRMLRANDEKNMQMAVMLSISDIYNSMHVIDLERNTVVEYSARDEVSEVVNHVSDVAETMKELMIMTTEEAYCKNALEFTDLHTLADRMQNKKIISKEFVSKAIGWYRASFITVEKDEEGRPTKVVYVTQNIDQEKKKEEALIIRSYVDELTGLYNRRAYEDDIAEYHDKPREENFVFVSFDVNGLKTVNDTLGHIAGDELLVGATTCMKRCFGPYGRVYRIGGDEFAAIIFANETQLQNIKKDFQETTEQWSGSRVKNLSISCGYVTKRESGTASVHEMANIADQKMYAAKSEFYARTPDSVRKRG